MTIKYIDAGEKRCIVTSHTSFNFKTEIGHRMFHVPPNVDAEASVPFDKMTIC
jgi:hypothetical protein